MVKLNFFLIIKQIIFFLVLVLVLIGSIQCDLYLFTKDKDIFEASNNAYSANQLNKEAADSIINGPNDDRLYLFPSVNNINCLFNKVKKYDFF
jgi:hypothetical protein